MTGIRCLKIAGVVAVLCAMAATSHAQTFTTIASFNLYLGRSPVAPLIQGPDGNFYGTTQSGGTTLNDPLCSPFGCGTVFKVTPSGTVTTLYNFCSKDNCADGTEPFAGLVLGTNGNFYGTTFSGGANDNRGTVFEITPQGKLTTLHSFCSQTDCPDGAQPLSGLTLGTDGNFYGTTIGGGSTFSGTAYRISPTGNFAVLYSFCSRTACADGAEPAGTLALATNGKFYGTAPLGGETDGGSIFQLTPSGLETVVHNFPGPENPDNIANGVMQGADGNLYGTSYLGGSNRFGYVFKLTPAGQFTRLYSFCSKANCSDGAEPQSELIQGTDGNLYGTTAGLGGNPFGTVFEITTTGNLTTLYDFCPQNFDCTDGATPEAGLLQATNGVFYGVTSIGGSSQDCSGGCGTIFSVSMGLSPFVQPYPSFGKAGQVIGILGNNLTGSTEVSFNGIPASFTVVSSTLIKATVPSGTATGPIEVTTPTGTLSSNVAFHVE